MKTQQYQILNDNKLVLSTWNINHSYEGTPIHRRKLQLVVAVKSRKNVKFVGFLVKYNV